MLYYAPCNTTIIIQNYNDYSQYCQGVHLQPLELVLVRVSPVKARRRVLYAGLSVLLPIQVYRIASRMNE